MASRVFLHVGTMKSATTYVQGLCDHNPDLLRGHGILWQGSAANFGAVHQLFDTDLDASERTGWQEFLRNIRQHDGDALVSNELLSMRSPRKIRQLARRLSPAKLEVVITARDLRRAIPSQWQERARNRPTGSWAEFMTRLTADGSLDDPELAWFWSRQDLALIAANWGGEVGMENVTLVTVPPSGAPFGVVAERFFGALGIDHLPDLVQPTAQNPALGAESIEFVRKLHDRLTDEERERLRIVLKHVVSRRVLAQRRQQEPTLGLSAEQVDWARRQAQSMIGRIDELGIRVVGDTDDLLPSTDGVEDVADPGATSSDDIVAVALDAVIGMADALDELARTSDSERYADLLRRLAH